MELKVYRIKCETEGVYIQTDYREDPPTVCPHDNTHTVDANDIIVVTSTSLTDPLAPVDYHFQGRGVNMNVAVGTTQELDYKVDDTSGLSGGRLLYSGAVAGDHIDIEIIDKDGIYYPAGTVLLKYLDNWYLDPTGNVEEIHKPFRGTVNKDLYVRLRYMSVGVTNPVWVSINYHFYKSV